MKEFVLTTCAVLLLLAHAHGAAFKPPSDSQSGPSDGGHEGRGPKAFEPLKAPTSGDRGNEGGKFNTSWPPVQWQGDWPATTQAPSGAAGARKKREGEHDGGKGGKNPVASGEAGYTGPTGKPSEETGYTGPTRKPFEQEGKHEGHRGHGSTTTPASSSAGSRKKRQAEHDGGKGVKNPVASGEAGYTRPTGKPSEETGYTGPTGKPFEQEGKHEGHRGHGSTTTPASSSE